MRKVVGVWLSLLLVFSSASVAAPQSGLDQRVTELSQQISKEMTENQKKTIAVVEFADLKGCVTDCGRYLAEVLITRLFQTKKFKVIERQLLNRVIAEQKLTLTGIIDPASAKKLGSLLGVDAIVSGTVTDLAQSLSVNARLISTETAEIFAVASTEIFKDDSVRALCKPGACPQESTGTGGPPPPGGPSDDKVKVKDLIFQLSSCRMSGRTLTCQFTVTNDSSEDVWFVLYAGGAAYGAPSRVFDKEGNESVASGCQIGTAGGAYKADFDLVSRIATKANLTFENSNSNANIISILRISFSVERDAYYADFRNVPIVK